jgi:hypothetical protein
VPCSPRLIKPLDRKISLTYRSLPKRSVEKPGCVAVLLRPPMIAYDIGPEVGDIFIVESEIDYALPLLALFGRQ